VSADALEAVDRILTGGGDADDVLRAVVTELAQRPGIAWVGILFLENGVLALGPQAGTPDEALRVHIPVVYQDAQVGELAVDGDAEPAFLERVAELLSAHVLLGWDTGGETWDP
jgi:hypothetical protein